MKTQSIKRRGEHDRRHEKICHADTDRKESTALVKTNTFSNR